MTADEQARKTIDRIRKYVDDHPMAEDWNGRGRQRFEEKCDTLRSIAFSMHCEEAAVLDAEIREGLLRSDLDDGMDGHGLDDELEFCEYLQGYIEEGFPAIWKNLESYIIDALDPTFSLYGFGNLVMNAVFIRRRIGEGDENASVCYGNLFRAWNEKDPAISSKTREILDGLDLDTEWYEQEYEEPR